MPDADEPERLPPPLSEPRTRIAKALNPFGVFPKPPAAWVKFLVDSKHLSPPTVKTYVYVVTLFLGYVQYRMQNQEPLLWYAWDKDLINGFFSILKTVAKPTSLINFRSGLTSVHHYLKSTGNRPADHIELMAEFDRQSANAHRERRKFIASEKNLSVREKGLLRQFYLDVYHNEDLWAEYNSVWQDIKYAISSERKVKPAISKKRLTFATSFMVCILTTCNFKRAGNLCLLEYQSTADALLQAFSRFKKNFPKEKIGRAPRRLDPSKCVPAVLPLKCSSKKGEPERLCVIRPRDIKALLYYCNYIRDFAPCNVSTDKFFITSKGRRLPKDVWYYLRKICERAGVRGLKGVTFNTLRRAIETENALSDSSVVSTHLGHSSSTVQQYYVIPDDRHAVKASFQLLGLLEQLGEADDGLTETATPLDNQVFLDLIISICL